MKGKRIIKRERMRLSRQAEIIFLAGLPVILIELLCVLSDILRDYLISPSYAASTYPPMLEYIMMSLTILVGGALLFDYIVKSYD